VNRTRPDELELAGELDLATRDLLIEAARAYRRRGGDLRLDAGGISFVDCAGLASLMELAQRTRASGGHFEITCSSSCLVRLSRLTGTDASLAG
jgi:anti-anti-sigma factor